MLVQNFDKPLMYKGRLHTMIIEPCEYCGHEPESVRTLPIEYVDITPLSKQPTVIQHSPNQVELSCGHVVSNYSIWLEPVEEE